MDFYAIVAIQALVCNVAGMRMGAVSHLYHCHTHSPSLQMVKKRCLSPLSHPNIIS